MKTLAAVLFASLFAALTACGGGGAPQVPAGGACPCGDHCECKPGVCKCPGGPTGCPHCAGHGGGAPVPAPAGDGGAP